MPTFDVSEVTPAKSQSFTFDPSEVTPIKAEPPKAKSWTERLASYLPDSYGKAQADIQESERAGAETVGKQMVEYSPITGVPEIASGLKNVVSPEKGTNRRQAARKVIGGVGKTLAPLAIPAAIAAPIPTAVGIAGGMAMQTGTTEGLKALGVDEDTAGLAGDIAGFIPPGAAARRVLGAVRKPFLPAPKPIENPPFKSAAESAKVFEEAFGRPEPATAQKGVKSPKVQKGPKSAEESAAVFVSQSRTPPPPKPKPGRAFVPEDGIPEGVSRAVDARDNLAQEMFGKPFSELRNPDRIAIDDLVTEGYGSATGKLPSPPSIEGPPPPIAAKRVPPMEAAVPAPPIKAQAKPLQPKAPGVDLPPPSSIEAPAGITPEIVTSGPRGVSWDSPIQPTTNANGVWTEHPTTRKIIAAAESELIRRGRITREDIPGLRRAAGDNLVTADHAVAYANKLQDFLAGRTAKIKAGGQEADPGVASLLPERPSATPLPKDSTPVADFIADESGTFKLLTRQDARQATQKVRTQLTDEYAPVKDLVADANLPVDADPYVGARLYAGHAGKIDNRLQDLRGILKPARAEGLMDAMRDYAVYERHEELAQRIPGYKLPGGQTIADIQAEKAALEKSLGANLPKVKQYVDGIRQYSDNLLTEARDAGVISAKAYNQIKATNQKYVPLQRLQYVADKLDEVPHGSKAFSVAKQDVVNRIQGSDKEILDPLQAMIRNTYKVVSLVERNKVARKMANLSTMPEFQGVVAPLKSGAVPQTGNGKFSALVDGVKYEYEAPIEVVEALKGMNRKEADLVTKMASMSSAALRAGATTLNLPFVASNAIRDFQTARLVSKVGFTPVDWAKGFAAAIKRGPEFRDFMESGGSFSGFMERNQSLPTSVKQLSESTGKKVLKTIVNPKALMELAGSTVELAPRIGVHMRSKAKGLTDAEAGFNARNATVDFAKSGNAMKVMNQWVPFLNARLQGTINTLGAVKDRPGAAALNLAALVGAPVLATYAWNKQFQDVMDDIAPFEKEGNFVIVYGRERDENGNPTQAIKIPKGDVGRVFGNPIENFLSYMDGKDHRTAGQLAMQIASDVSPVSFEKEGKFSGSAVMSGTLPPTVKAGVEGVTNKNIYTEREIVPKNLQDASPEEQYKADTPSWLVKLGQFTGVSPLKWQNAIGTQFGGLGRQIAEPSKALSTMQKRFVGARGGEQEQKQWDVLAESKTESANERVRRDRTAKQLYDEIMPLPPQERAAIVQKRIAEGTADEAVLESVADLIEKNETPAIERSLKSAPVEARAIFMLKRLQSVPPAERVALFESWEKQNLITDKVVDAIEARLAAQ